MSALTSLPSSRLLRPIERSLLAAWGTVCFAGFLLAFWLTPDPRGYGTHQQLGLESCGMQVWWGMSCPFCGMTTSASAFVRGQWGKSLQANVAGWWMCLAALVLLPVVYRWCSTGQVRRGFDPWAVLCGWMISVLSLSVLQWIVREWVLSSL